jgi:hypothetical protein
MATGVAPETSSLQVNVFDGARQPVAPGDWRMIRIPCFEPGQNPARC